MNKHVNYVNGGKVINLPNRKTLNGLVECVHYSKFPPKMSKTERVNLTRNNLVDADGVVMPDGMVIYNAITTIPLPPSFDRYGRGGEGVALSHDGTLWFYEFVALSHDGTIWFYRDTYTHYSDVKTCLAVNFRLLMFGVPT